MAVKPCDPSYGNQGSHKMSLCNLCVWMRWTTLIQCELMGQCKCPGKLGRPRAIRGRRPACGRVNRGILTPLAPTYLLRIHFKLNTLNFKVYNTTPGKQS